MERSQPTRPSDADRDTEAGRISRSGTEAGISIGSESTSGGSDPIEPGRHVQPEKPGKDRSPQRKD
ncbi:MAG TPA: hypothetical protein VGG99_14095 [Acetobacteraceae bacterium]